MCCILRKVNFGLGFPSFLYLDNVRKFIFLTTFVVNLLSKKTRRLILQPHHIGIIKDLHYWPFVQGIGHSVLPHRGPVAHFTRSLYKFITEILKILFALILITMLQSCQNSAHVTTAELSWHVQNCDMISLLFFSSEHHIILQDFDYEFINPLWNGSQWCRKSPNWIYHHDIPAYLFVSITAQ